MELEQEASLCKLSGNDISQEKFNFCFLFLGDPSTNEKATTDPYKTLFIARLVSENDLYGIRKR